MAKKEVPPLALHDFYKANASDTAHYNSEPSLTRQEFAEECDINALMKRYEGHVTGGPGNLAPQVPLYVDWSSMPTDLMNYMERMNEAEKAFMSLPAVVRKEFDNNAVAFVDFASDPANLEAMRGWGLAAAAKAPDASAEVGIAPDAPTVDASPKAP